MHTAATANGLHQDEGLGLDWEFRPSITGSLLVSPLQGTDNSTSINFCSIGTCATSTAAIGKGLLSSLQGHQQRSCRRFTNEKKNGDVSFPVQTPNSASDLTRLHGKFQHRWSGPRCSVPPSGQIPTGARESNSQHLIIPVSS